MKVTKIFVMFLSVLCILSSSLLMAQDGFDVDKAKVKNVVLKKMKKEKDADSSKTFSKEEIQARIDTEARRLGVGERGAGPDQPKVPCKCIKDGRLAEEIEREFQTIQGTVEK